MSKYDLYLHELDEAVKVHTSEAHGQVMVKIRGELSPDLQVEYDKLLAAVCRLLNFHADEQWLAVNDSPQKPEHYWRASMSYHHKGFGWKYAELGEIDGLEFPEAVDKSREMAEAFIAQAKIVTDITDWQIKVVPAKRPA